MFLIEFLYNSYITGDGMSVEERRDGSFDRILAMSIATFPLPMITASLTFLRSKS
jgi:hypothetical protein